MFLTILLLKKGKIIGSISNNNKLTKYFNVSQVSQDFVGSYVAD